MKSSSQSVDNLAIGDLKKTLRNEAQDHFSRGGKSASKLLRQLFWVTPDERDTLIYAENLLKRIILGKLTRSEKSKLREIAGINSASNHVDEEALGSIVHQMATVLKFTDSAEAPEDLSNVFFLVGEPKDKKAA